MSTKKKIPARRLSLLERVRRNKKWRARRYQSYTDPEGYDSRLKAEAAEKKAQEIADRAARIEKAKREARERHQEK